MASAKGPFGREDLDGNLAGRDGSAVPDEDVMQGVEHSESASSSPASSTS